MLRLSVVNRSEISRLTGANLSHISRIFNKKERPSLELAKKIANAMGVTLDELCEARGITGELIE